MCYYSLQPLAKTLSFVLSSDLAVLFCFCAKSYRPCSDKLASQAARQNLPHLPKSVTYAITANVKNKQSALGLYHTSPSALTGLILKKKKSCPQLRELRLSLASFSSLLSAFFCSSPSGLFSGYKSEPEDNRRQSRV